MSFVYPYLVRLYKLMVLFICMPFWVLAQSKAPVASTDRSYVLGTIRTFYSKVLGEERVLNVYLPEGYSEKDTTRYAVIYLLDGGADEDFLHITGLVQYNSFEWVNRVPKSIVIGIVNGNRRRDFTFPTHVPEDKRAYPESGHSDRFIRFLETEVQPMVERTYRTNSQKTLIGQSLAGLLAIQIFFQKPNLFTHYVIVSPSIWWNGGSILKADVSRLQAVSQEIRIYLAVGKEGATPGKPSRTMEDDAALLRNKIAAVGNECIRLYFEYLPEENHATIMHQAVMNAFKVLYR